MIDINLTNYISTLEVDKTIAVFKGSLTIPAGGSNSVNHALPIGAGHTFWEGTYTLDGSTQQNDIGGLQYSGLRGAGLEARSYVGGILVRGVNTTGSSVVANYNLSVIASPETGIIPAQGTFPSLDNPFAFDSRDDTRKIVFTRSFGDNAEDSLSTGVDSSGRHFHTLTFGGDEQTLAETKRIKIFYVAYDTGLMYDLSASYIGSGIISTDRIVKATYALYTSSPDFDKAYIRFYYE